VFDADDDGSRATLGVGDTFEVRLAGNPSTGYMWEVEPNAEPVCRMVGEPEFIPESTLVGAPGEFVFDFEVVSIGSEDLKLVYHRSWEDAEPLDTFGLTLNVSS
jgi:inhibitor of cysteine peptidase